MAAGAMIQVDPQRAIADLRELDRRTGGPGGARRVCWTDEWRHARDFLRERLAAIDGVASEVDEAGNLWATLPGERADAVAVGSHLDSVPAGGWLDGALGVIAALEVLRAAAEAATPPHHAVTLIDFADEEGARFGRSLFGSSAVAGTLDPDAVATLRDADGRPIADVLADHGVDLTAAPAAAARRASLAAYLELHIEQGPVLERDGVAVAAVTGTAGVERHRLTFTGQAAHAGTTPMALRHDAGLAAAETMLAVEKTAGRHGGVGTTGGLTLHPGIATAVAGEAALLVDLRHPHAQPLAQMLTDVRAAAAAAADRRGVTLAEAEIWRIEPIPFDERLVAAARAEADGGTAIPSGALHDAAEMARHMPTAMMFTSSTGGLSHAKEEDTPEDHLERAIAAFGRLAARAIAGELLLD
jgi:hydantoinase/carbamoylase family amidase